MIICQYVQLYDVCPGTATVVDLYFYILKLKMQDFQF